MTMPLWVHSSHSKLKNCQTKNPKENCRNSTDKSKEGCRVPSFDKLLLSHIKLYDDRVIIKRFIYYIFFSFITKYKSSLLLLFFYISSNVLRASDTLTFVTRKLNTQESRVSDGSRLFHHFGTLHFIRSFLRIGIFRLWREKRLMVRRSIRIRRFIMPHVSL